MPMYCFLHIVHVMRYITLFLGLFEKCDLGSVMPTQIMSWWCAWKRVSHRKCVACACALMGWISIKMWARGAFWVLTGFYARHLLVGILGSVPDVLCCLCGWDVDGSVTSLSKSLSGRVQSLFLLVLSWVLNVQVQWRGGGVLVLNHVVIV